MARTVPLIHFRFNFCPGGTIISQLKQSVQSTFAHRVILTQIYTTRHDANIYHSVDKPKEKTLAAKEQKNNLKKRWQSEEVKPAWSAVTRKQTLALCWPAENVHVWSTGLINCAEDRGHRGLRPWPCSTRAILCHNYHKQLLCANVCVDVMVRSTSCFMWFDLYWSHEWNDK